MTAANLEAVQALLFAEIAHAREVGTGITLGGPAVEVLDDLFRDMDQLTVSYFLAAGELAVMRAERDDLAQRLAAVSSSREVLIERLRETAAERDDLARELSEANEHRRLLQGKLTAARAPWRKR